jgi:hypothetical protein
MGIEELLVRQVNRDRRYGTPAFSGIDRPNANAPAQGERVVTRRNIVDF